MEKTSNVTRWIAAAKARGQAPFLLTLLDAIGPIAPLLASGLLVAQPLLPWSGALRELADLLEEPEGVELLRRSLAEEPME